MLSAAEHAQMVEAGVTTQTLSSHRQHPQQRTPGQSI